VVDNTTLLQYNYYKHTKQIYGEVYVEFEPSVEGGHLDAVLRGEAIDLERHDLRIEVKAVTWHDFEFRTTPRGLEARIADKLAHLRELDRKARGGAATTKSTKDKKET